MGKAYRSAFSLSLILGIISPIQAGVLIHVPGVSSPAEARLSIEATGSRWTSFPGHLLVYLENAPAALPQNAQLLFEGESSELSIIASKHDDPRELLGDKQPILFQEGRYAIFAAPEHRLERIKGEIGHCTTLIPFPESGAMLERTVPVALASDTAKADPAVQALVSSVKTENLRAKLEQLVGFQTRYSTTNGYKQATEHARGIFEGLGYETKLEPFDLWGDSVNNVIARQTGTTRPDEIYIVCAHLDSTSWNADEFAPGADDNGTGSSAVLEIARVMATVKPAATVLYILWGGEEEGLVGSEAFVSQFETSGDLAKIKGVINMDMIGYNKNAELKMTIETKRSNMAMLNVVSQAATTYTQLQVHQSFHAWGSDHVPFLQKGIPSLLTIEYEYDDNPNDHTPRDTIDDVNMDLVTEIAKTNVAALCALAGPVSQGQAD